MKITIKENKGSSEVHPPRDDEEGHALMAAYLSAKPEEKGGMLQRLMGWLGHQRKRLSLEGHMGSEGTGLSDIPHEESLLDADEVGEFIVEHGGVEEALAYVEAMRQEIIELMDEEDEEIQFPQNYPMYQGNPVVLPHGKRVKKEGVAQAAAGAAGGKAGQALGGAVGGPAGAVVGGIIGAKAGEKIAQKVAEKPEDPLEPKNKDVTKALEYIGDKAGMYMRKVNTRSKKKEFLHGILDFLDMQAADMMTNVKANVKDQKAEKAAAGATVSENTIKESKVLIKVRNKVRKNKCL